LGRRNRLVQYVVDQAGREPDAEWTMSGGHFIQHHTCGVDITAAVDLLPAKLLRGHVRQGPGYVVNRSDGLGLRRFPWRLQQHGESKVEQLHGARGRDHDVAGFEVAVHHGTRMGALQGPRDLLADRENLLFGQRAGAQHVGESCAHHIFHDQKIGPVLGVEIVNGCNVRVIEFGQRHCFFAESLPVSFINQSTRW
jgi:hypothetical protein